MSLKLFLLSLFAGLGVGLAQPDSAQPWKTADFIQESLLQAQAALLVGDTDAAVAHVAAAQEAVTDWTAFPPESQELLQQALTAAATAAAAGDADALAGARGRVRGVIFWGSYVLTRQAVRQGDMTTAQQWLLVRDYRPSTRFSRPGADATLALRQSDTVGIDEVLSRLDADLLDTYQARLGESLQTVLDTTALTGRRAEAAGLASAIWHILVPAYTEQQGMAAADAVTAQVDQLLPAILQSDETMVQATGAALQTTWQSFRAAPLTVEEQARRAAQMLRFLALVPVEYGRGVQGTTVLTDLEVQEAVTFMQGAQAAFADLQLALMEIDAAQTAVLADQIAQVMADLNAANHKQAVISPADMEAKIKAITAALKQLFPTTWLAGNSAADFDVLASVLDQMETAVRAGDYQRAELARLEAYAIFDVGPEPRLRAFAPPLEARIHTLFWYGDTTQPGLAQAIALTASPAVIAEVRGSLDDALSEAQVTLGDLSSAPGAIIANAAIIVFREGLESVVILAALMASMVGAYAHYRRPMALGAILSLVGTAFTWILAQQVLSSLARFGERLEAVVSLIAIGVLLLITNWFFHKTYWKDWMAGFHAQKRRLLSRETGQFVGLVLLGFTSMYREGFETVLFLQALALDAGTAVVLQGVALGAVAVTIVGIITFRVQTRLPYKQMLVWTGVLIGFVLVTMVGKTVYVLQAVGWLGITPLPALTFPYWAGLWLGLHETWQGIVAQIGAAGFVVGSYYLAEWAQGRRRQTYRRESSAPTTNAALTHPVQRGHKNSI